MRELTNEKRSLKKLWTFMNIAEVLGGLGTCDRKKVGAVIVRDGRCISWGFNGAPPGLPHCEENNHGWHEEDWPTQGMESPKGWENRMVQEKGCRNATHAEANALAFAAREGISTDEATLFVIVSPCESCARLIIAAGIVAVYYLEAYRKDDGCRILDQASIPSSQLQ